MPIHNFIFHGLLVPFAVHHNRKITLMLLRDWLTFGAVSQ
jgi:hypothetical protein